jgi:hypothetical protein
VVSGDDEADDDGDDDDVAEKTPSEGDGGLAASDAAGLIMLRWLEGMVWLAGLRFFSTAASTPLSMSALLPMLELRSWSRWCSARSRLVLADSLALPLRSRSRSRSRVSRWSRSLPLPPELRCSLAPADERLLIGAGAAVAKAEADPFLALLLLLLPPMLLPVTLSLVRLRSSS